MYKPESLHSKRNACLTGLAIGGLLFGCSTAEGPQGQPAMVVTEVLDLYPSNNSFTDPMSEHLYRGDEVIVTCYQQGNGADSQWVYVSGEDKEGYARPFERVSGNAQSSFSIDFAQLRDTLPDCE